MNRISWYGLAVLSLTLIVIGCGPGGPKLYKAGGTVTHKTKPVEGAVVTFAYADGTFSSGNTDATGKFTLNYANANGGAKLGKCTVSVSKVASTGTAPPPGASPAQMMEAMKKTVGPMKEGAAKADPNLLPKKYASPATSGLSYEITTSEKDNDFKIDLMD